MNVQDSHKDDAVNVAPHLHKIVFEDDKLRVLKVTVEPKAKADMHRHTEKYLHIFTAWWVILILDSCLNYGYNFLYRVEPRKMISKPSLLLRHLPY